MLNNLAQVYKNRLKTILYTPHLLFDYLFFSIHGIKWDKTWRIRGLPLIQRSIGSKIIIGKRFTAVSRSRYNSWGVSQPVIIKARRKETLIRIGNDVGLSGCTITALDKIKIGNEVLIGSGVIIADNDAHPIYPDNRRYKKVSDIRPVIVKNNVFIGARAIILKGVTINNGAVVAAGSIVTKDVPEFAIVGGIPSQILGNARDHKYIST